VNDVKPETFGFTLEDDIAALNTDEPIVVAEIVDERPEIVKKLEQYSNSKWKRLANDEDDEIKRYEEMILNQAKESDKKKISTIDDDDDLDHMRSRMVIKQEKTDSNEVVKIKKSKNKNKIEVVKIKQEKVDEMEEQEEEIDETKVRVRKQTVEDKMEKARKEERKEKYMEWGKGLVQKKMREEKLEDDIHEAEKPLARYIDDQDLDKMLREKEREEDPMLQYIKKANLKEGDVEKKQYKGPAPAPNRYGIKPGYRWDGVDRSNGFEKKYFESLAKKQAVEYERYKWSVEDM